jgi:polysaccharide biosynthesis/export protein
MVKIKLFAIILLSLCLAAPASGQFLKIFKKKNKEKKVEQTVETPKVENVIKVEPDVLPTPTPEPMVVATPKVPITDKTAETFRYRIGLLDQIQVEVYNHPELSKIYNVSEQGSISIPRSSKPIFVLCKTENQVSEEIKTEYKKFLRQPDVNARVTSQNSQPVAVIGAVERPANFYLTRRVTLLELISYAGGAKTGDGKKAGTKVQIARVGGGVSGCSQNDDANTQDDSALLDNMFAYYKLQDVYDLRKNPEIRPGDIVRVLESDEVYIIGNVKEAKKIDLKDKMTVSQAIASAGGLASAAKKDKVVIRRVVNGTPTDITIDLEKIDKRQAVDVELLAEDIIYVPTDKLKNGLNKFLDGITGGASNLLLKVPTPK